ncbi:uncharacterized protein LOC129292133 [Prosopis cineraria]|uniref:uncharacterized protein LOC129292133 n=1 Tax=Prosopis cineraria TaxID=364024 RepID=UPI00240FAC77|nr:uncharacterized protein LOC129292133 [Prosopis cineraria]
MNMDNRRYNVNARSLPVSNALHGSSTVISELEPLHRRPDVVLNEQGLPRHSGRTRLKKLVHKSKIRFGTWNVGTLNCKSVEVVGVMIQRKINILCLQETKWRGEEAKDIQGFKLWYTGKVSARNGVGIIIDKEWKKNVVEVSRIGDRIISLKMIIGRETVNIVSAYAPQVGTEASLKELFWEDLEGLIRHIPQSEKIFIGGDFNGHVGREAGQYARVHGGFGFGELNNEGQTLLDFSLAYDFKIANTCFKKRDEHLITYKSGASRSQIDFLLVRNTDRKLCKNCKVIPGDAVTTQHRVLVLDVCIMSKIQKRRQVVTPRIRWWQLKGEKQDIFKRNLLDKGIWDSQGSANIIWEDMAKKIREVAKVVLGESKGSGPRDKESWWWNNSVQDKIKYKKNCFKAIHLCNNEENWERYRMAKKETKRAVGEARSKAFEEFYKNLETKEGEQNIYKIAKSRERK